MLVTTKNKSEIDKLKTQFSGEFEMKDLEATNKILGMKIYQDKKVRKLYLSQKNYFVKLLERFSIHDSKHVSTPLTNHFKLSTDLLP